jgi:predicted lipoprotein with Yx(FWY)xxD motif
MFSVKKLVIGPIVLAVLLAGCSNAATSSAPGGNGSPAAGGSTVMVKSLGGANGLVAGSNNMTLYTFDSDVANNGKSACTGGCATTWPPLTVPSGTTPTAGAGASGALKTITRDDGSIQVTYNGMPLHFYSGDTAPGDTNGHYPGWNIAKP